MSGFQRASPRSVHDVRVAMNGLGWWTSIAAVPLLGAPTGCEVSASLRIWPGKEGLTVQQVLRQDCQPTTNKESLRDRHQ